MITRQDALDHVQRYVNEAFPLAGDTFSVWPEKTIEKPYGWIVYYAPKRFLETGDPMYLPAGCAPFLVRKDDARLVPLGTARPLESYLREYENQDHSL